MVTLEKLPNNSMVVILMEYFLKNTIFYTNHLVINKHIIEDSL